MTEGLVQGDGLKSAVQSGQSTLDREFLRVSKVIKFTNMFMKSKSMNSEEKTNLAGHDLDTHPLENRMK